jgi:hypothetical protein
MVCHNCHLSMKEIWLVITRRVVSSTYLWAWLSASLVMAAAASFCGSLPTGAVVVQTLVPTTTSMEITPNPAVYAGTFEKVSASVAGTGGTPTGSLDFSEGSTTLCTTELFDGSGYCYYSIENGLRVGSEVITATYSGDATFASSSSSSALKVTRAIPMIGVTAKPSPAPFGSIVSYSATLALVPFNGVGSPPTGTVTFKVGAVVLCIAKVSISNGTGTASCSASNAPLGHDPVLADYSGDANFKPNSQLSATSLVQIIPTLSSAQGYLEVSSAGEVFAFGSATNHGSCSGIGGCSGSVVTLIPDADELGYWIVTSTGHVYGFGNAASLGAPGSTPGPVVAAQGSPSGDGYFIADAKGNVYAYGDVVSHGSIETPLAHPIVGIAVTPDAGGYWLVDSAGDIFHFGDATSEAPTGSTPKSPVKAIAATPDGGGYWLLASTGKVYQYGDAQFFGDSMSLANFRPAASIAVTPDGHGYWILTMVGAMISFGDASFQGSAMAPCFLTVDKAKALVSGGVSPASSGMVRS